MADLELVNAEGLLVLHLETLGPEQASTRIPNPRPAAFYRVQRTGGFEANLIQETPTLLIECYAATTFAAWELANRAWASLQGRTELEVDGVDLTDRTLSLPVNYPDPVTNQARYTFTLSTTITLKESTP